MQPLAIQPNSRRAFALALLLLALALATQWLLRPVLGSSVPFLFVLPAIGIAAMWGGWRPGMVVLAGGLAHAVVWLRARDPVASVHPLADEAALAGYLLASGLLLAMGGRISVMRVRAAQAERDLSEQVHDLRTLNELSARIAVRTELGTQMQMVLEALCGLLAARRGLLCLCDAQPAEARLTASVGFTPAQLQAELPPVLAALRQGMHRDAPVAGHAGVLQLRPLLRADGRLFGTLALERAAGRPATEREQRLRDLFADMVAVLVEREEALRQATASSRRLEVALETSAVPFCLLLPLQATDGEVRGFRWEYANAAAGQLLGRDPAALAGRPVRETLDSTVRVDPGLREQLASALHERRTSRFETWAEADNGRRWFEFIASPHGRGVAVWFSDVTQRRAQEAALREADRRKDEFLATLAHELRNPLAPIRQAALIARSPAATQQQQQWSHGVIERQVGHMAMLLDDLLDVSRITRGKLVLRRAPVALAEAVEAALEAAGPLVEKRRQTLRTTLPEQPAWLLADRLRVAQVLSNLLTNASKYTPPGGHILLAARCEDGHALIDVSDDGAGIAPEALEAIFQMFTQVRGGEDGRGGGLGIGLALSRGLVELHGGTLTARSEGAGRGSTFTVRLPLADAPAAPAAAPLPAPAAPVRPLRILVADDNRDAACSLADLLRMEGHEVALAFDGREALDCFTASAPEVAVLDIGMPHMSGNEVAQAIRAHAAGTRTLLVAVTGWGQEQDRQAAQQAGFDFHFTKPVDPRQVLELLRQAPVR